MSKQTKAGAFVAALPRHQTRWGICPHCDGNGTKDHPAFSNGITSSEWAEWDEDDREQYMRGAYDVPCVECSGSGKVREVAHGTLSFSQLRELAQARRQDSEDYAADADTRYWARLESLRGC